MVSKFPSIFQGHHWLPLCDCWLLGRSSTHPHRAPLRGAIETTGSERSFFCAGVAGPFLLDMSPSRYQKDLDRTDRTRKSAWNVSDRVSISGPWRWWPNPIWGIHKAPMWLMLGFTSWAPTLHSRRSFKWDGPRGSTAQGGRRSL